MKSKYKINIEGLEGFRFGEDKKLYKLPYQNKQRSYALKEIKLQYPSRYVLDGGTWSQNQLRCHLELDKNPIELFPDIQDTPF